MQRTPMTAAQAAARMNLNASLALLVLLSVVFAQEDTAAAQRPNKYKKWRQENLPKVCARVFGALSSENTNTSGCSLDYLCQFTGQGCVHASVLSSRREPAFLCWTRLRTCATAVS